MSSWLTGSDYARGIRRHYQQLPPAAIAAFRLTGEIHAIATKLEVPAGQYVCPNCNGAGGVICGDEDLITSAYINCNLCCKSGVISIL